MGSNEKAELKTFKTASKRVKVKVKDTVIDLKGSLSKYEFSVVLRALFSSDGSMHHCLKKSDLMKTLEAIPPKEGSNGAASQHKQNLSDMKVAIVVGMAEVQAIDKPKSIKDLGHHFASRIKAKFGTYDEVHVIFDDYTVKNSLKTATRSKRLGGLASVRYKIIDSTKIQHIPMKKLLSLEGTKDELTMFFSEKIMYMAMKTSQQYVVAWRKHVDSSFDLCCHASSHEEADTKIIFHAIKAKERGATQLDVYSPDTDVFILLIRRYPQLPMETSFVTGRGTQQRKIQIKKIYDELGPAKAAALPGFHAFTGADITGSFAGKGKLQCWKIFNQADQDVIQVFTDLGSSKEISENICIAIEKFVCRLYHPKSKITDIGELRWLLFRQKQWQAEKLPPTRASLVPTIQRAHFQALIWFQDNQAHQVLPHVTNYGWENDDHGGIRPIMCTLPPAPEAILELVKCSCVKNKCTT